MARARRADLPFLPQCHSVLSMRRCSTSARRRRGWATGRHALGRRPGMAEGGESTPCRPRAPRLLPPAVCAVRGAGTPPGPSAWASGTGRAAAEESLSHPAGGPHAKRRQLGPALGGFAATFRGLFSSSSREVRLPGPALASCILFFFHEPSLHPIPNASGTLRAQV